MNAPMNAPDTDYYLKDLQAEQYNSGMPFVLRQKLRQMCQPRFIEDRVSAVDIQKDRQPDDEEQQYG